MNNDAHSSSQEMTGRTVYLEHEKIHRSTQQPLVNYHIKHAPAFNERLKTHLGESILATIEDNLSGRLVDVSQDAITVMKNKNPHYIRIDRIAYFEKS